METLKLYIFNLKCGGCASTIKSELIKVDGVNEVEVDFEESLLSFKLNENTNPDTVKNRLKQLGYPCTDDKNNFLDKAKSYVSCMRGRLN